MSTIIPRSIHSLLASLVLLVVAGCNAGSQTGTVTGTLHVDGIPLGGFEVRFYSVADGSMAIGSAGADGHFTLIRGRGEKQITVGDYKVTIDPTDLIEGVPEPKIKIPQELAAAGTTTLTKTVSSGANVIDLDISTQ